MGNDNERGSFRRSHPRGDVGCLRRHTVLASGPGRCAWFVGRPGMLSLLSLSGEAGRPMGGITIATTTSGYCSSITAPTHVFSTTHLFFPSRCIHPADVHGVRCILSVLDSSGGNSASCKLPEKPLLALPNKGIRWCVANKPLQPNGVLLVRSMACCPALPYRHQDGWIMAALSLHWTVQNPLIPPNSWLWLIKTKGNMVFFFHASANSI
ncbi:hypothetical protein B0I35DRAFT_21406 [Stachybotrys elegans]|uniref:Uncharacterized protein n=1 Tax=Stachybotrys elegans TaxID=80388 RepID=A0A8K0T499_9HYPO|nr:hypothetical protein B0I35DRAFT_21406 [Stachybotrys elegans]